MMETAKKLANEEFGDNKNHAEYVKILKIQISIAISHQKYQEALDI